MLSIQSSLSSTIHAYQAKVVLPSLTSYQKKVTALALLALSLLGVCYFLLKSYWFRAQLQNPQNINANPIQIGPVNGQVKEDTELDLDPMTVDTVLGGNLQAIPHLYPKLKKLSLWPCVNVTDEDLQQLARLPFLEDLDLLKSDIHFTAKGLAYLKDCSSLHSLKLGDTYDRITDEYLKQLKDYPALQNLQLFNCKQVTAKSLAYLKNCSSLHALELYDSDQLTDEYLKHVKQISSLRVLSLRGCQRFTEEGLKHLAALSHLETLELLSGDYQSQIKGAYLKRLQDFPSLQNLKLNYIKDEDLEYLKDLSLQALELSYCARTDKGLEYLQTLPLRSLDVSYCHNGITDKGLEYLKACPLENLNLTSCESVTDKGLEYLKACPLKNLNLTGCTEITDDGLAYLQHMSSLQVLNLTCCKRVTDKGLEYLKACPLKNLNLTCCTEITDDGLAYLQHMSSLQVLSLEGCEKLTEKGFAYLKNLSDLQELNIKYCYQVKEEHIEQLKELSSLRVLTVINDNDSRAFPQEYEEILKQANPLLKIVHEQTPC